MVPELAPLHEAADDLHVGPVAVVHAHHHHTVALLHRAHDTLGARGRHRQRLLHQHVDPGRQRRENVRLVQVRGGADHHRVQRLEAQQILDVVEGVLDAEAIGEGAGLGQVGVADRRVSRSSCSFLSTGRCATWVIAPPPMIPTLSRSPLVRLPVMRPS